MAAPAQVVTRQILEKIPKCKLHWLQTQVPKYVDEKWRGQVSGALNKCIDNYDDSAGGYLVEYHQKVYGADAYARQWASCGMQRLYGPFRGILAKAMELTDWDMVNCSGFARAIVRAVFSELSIAHRLRHPPRLLDFPRH